MSVIEHPVAALVLFAKQPCYHPPDKYVVSSKNLTYSTKRKTGYIDSSILPKN